jgi:hypothetical protein
MESTPPVPLAKADIAMDGTFRSSPHPEFQSHICQYHKSLPPVILQLFLFFTTKTMISNQFNSLPARDLSLNY